MPLNTALIRCFIALVLCISGALLPELAAGRALTEKDAVVDQQTQQKLCSPQTGSELMLKLHKVAKNNEVDPYGLANEACRVMASNVRGDLDLFSLRDLTYPERLALVRLESELIQHAENGCHYRDWVRLSAKFCQMTGFIRYRQNPDQYCKRFAGGNEPRLKTSLCELEQLPWAYFNDVLAGEDRTAPDFDSVFGHTLHYLQRCVRRGSFVFPGFQELNLEYFIRVGCLGFFPAAVFLGDRIQADGYWMSREMFFLHDIGHADFSAGSWKSARLWNIPPEDKLLLQMEKELGMVDYLYTRRDQINAFEKGIFKVVELVLFIESHEEHGAGFLGCLCCSQGRFWSLMYKANREIVKKFSEGQFEDLEPEYGCCHKNKRQLHLGGLFLTSLSNQRDRYTYYDLEGFKQAVDECLGSFYRTVGLYNILDIISRESILDAEEFIAGWSPHDLSPPDRKKSKRLNSTAANVRPVKPKKLSDFIGSEQSRQWFFGAEQTAWQGCTVQ